jgi:hypothetical protein
VKTARSFVGMFAGWCAAFTTLIAWQVLRKPGFGYVTDFTFFLYWPALFGLVAWAICVAPLLSWLEDENPWLRPSIIWASGALLGLVLFLLLVCTWAPSLVVFAWFPIIQGAVGGIIYAGLGRWSWLEKRPAWARTILMSGPPVLLLCFSLLLWPLVIHRAPYFAYRFGADESRAAAHLRILQGVKVGDTFADLHRLYPKLFSQPYLSSTGNIDGHHSYRIRFDPSLDHVTEISIQSKP